MPQKFLSSNRRIKVYVIALVLLLIPTMVLAYLGYQQIFIQTQSLEFSYRDLLKRSLSLAEEELIVLTKENIKQLSGLTPELTRPIRKTSDTGIQSLFQHHFALTNEGNRFFPLSWSDVKEYEITTEIAVSLTTSSKMEILIVNKSQSSTHPLSFAYQAIGQKNNNQAIEILETAINNEKYINYQDVMMRALAGCYFSLGDYSKAIDIYEQVLKKYFSKNRFHVLVQYQIGLCNALSNNHQKTSEIWLSLYKDLLNLKEIMVTKDIRRFYIDKVKGGLKEYSPDSLQDNKYLGLEKEERQILEEEKVISPLDEIIIPEIKARQLELLMGKPSNEPIFFSAWGKKYYLISLTKGTDQEKNNSLIWGCLIDIEQLDEKIIKPSLNHLDYSSYEIVSAEGRVLIAKNPPSKDNGFITERFDKTLPLKIILYLPKSTKQKIHEQKLLYTGFLVIMMIVLGTGIYLLIKSTMREIRLAQMKSDFVSNVSHELRTPLSLIRMFGELLKFKYAKTEEEKQKYYEIITRESERLTQLINNVLDFSKIDANRKDYHFEPSDIVSVVENTVEAFRVHLSGEGFQIKTDFAPELPLINIDKDAISQLVLNLLDNAVKYSKDEKYIEINLRKVNNEVRLEVIDKGIGIESKYFDKIFDRFYRIESGLTRETRGAGLGLALVKHIAEVHGAKVEVQSEIGKGSKFTIKLYAETSNTNN